MIYINLLGEIMNKQTNKHNTNSFLKYAETKRPALIKEIQQRVLKYIDDPNYIKTLNYANGSESQQRSERRTSCVKTIQALSQHLDLATLKVGYIYYHGWKSLSIEEIATMSEQSYSVTKRALQDIANAGIIEKHSSFYMDDQSKPTGAPSVIVLNPSFFATLGLYNTSAKERKKAATRFNKNLNDFFLSPRKISTPKSHFDRKLAENKPKVKNILDKKLTSLISQTKRTKETIFEYAQPMHDEIDFDQLVAEDVYTQSSNHETTKKLSPEIAEHFKKIGGSEKLHQFLINNIDELISAAIQDGIMHQEVIEMIKKFMSYVSHDPKRFANKNLLAYWHYWLSNAQDNNKKSKRVILEEHNTQIAEKWLQNHSQPNLIT
ncbi:MAG: hypothetical protein GY739_10830 [Mesoflavibacter sp.]|nr:hypothetical protein [Mesoflavibacter sp.]